MLTPAILRQHFLVYFLLCLAGLRDHSASFFLFRPISETCSPVLPILSSLSIPSFPCLVSVSLSSGKTRPTGTKSKIQETFSFFIFHLIRLCIDFSHSPIGLIILLLRAFRPLPWPRPSRAEYIYCSLHAWT